MTLLNKLADPTTFLLELCLPFENPLRLVWLLKRTGFVASILYDPDDSLPSTALLPPKKEVLRFLLARKAIDKLPEVFWNIPPLVERDDSPPNDRLRGSGGILLPLRLDCDP